MLDELKNERRSVSTHPGLASRVGWFVAKLLAAFLFISVAQVIIYKFVPDRKSVV